MDSYQTPLSMGILQARILEWVAMPSSRASSHPGIEPISVFEQILYHLSHRKLVLFKRLTGWKRAHVPLVLFPEES